LSSGTRPPNPSELLLHERFASTLEQLSKICDHVIIDSPPILPVTDATVIGPLAGATFLVVKSGIHTLREIDESIKRLTRAGTHLRGVVFNDLKIGKKRHGFGRYYGYTYSYSSEK
jgi:tyrosine-protein kinase Etk/Wzc